MAHRIPRTFRRLRFALIAVLIASFGRQFTWGEEHESEVKNPFEGNPIAIEGGNYLFRTNCAFCHGLDARGGARGPDLTIGRWVHCDSDTAIFRTITRGVPGSQMPANDLSEKETWKVIAYLRSLSSNIHPPVLGSRGAGEKIFFGKDGCSQCHMVGGRGGRLGPDLSRIGSSRSTDYLVDVIRDPNKKAKEWPLEADPHFGPPAVYKTVLVKTLDGTCTVGVPRNEDSFSIQLMDQGEQLHMFLKKNLEEVVHDRQSMMPEYTERMLSEKDLQDLLAYLDSLRR